MKRTIPLLIVIAAVVGGILWLRARGSASPPAPAPGETKPADEEAEGPKITRDANGRAVVTMNDEQQGNLGIQVTNPAALRLNPELKGYGRVLDPAPLAALGVELSTAQAAYTASSNELARLQTLSQQGNASARVLQAAEAAARRDQLAVQSARDRVRLTWGKTISERADLPAFLQAATALDAAVVRIDFPVGQAPPTPPSGARIETLSGLSPPVELLGPAPMVDPQMLGQGYFLLAQPNSANLSAGEAVVGYLTVKGEPLQGVLIPRDAVVRTEGAGWVYVLDKSRAEAFTRTEIPLDHPTDAGWFVTKGVTTNDYVVVKGAQQLLSTEMRIQGPAAE